MDVPIPFLFSALPAYSGRSRGRHCQSSKSTTIFF